MLVKNKQKRDLKRICQTILLISLVLTASLLILQLGVAVATATEDQYEPDNDHREAHVIRNAQPQQHSIYPIGDQDWLELRIDFESDVTIETYGPTGDTEMWLYQRNVNNPPLGYDNDGGEGLFSKIFVHLAAGIYYVKIGEYGNDGEISEYNVRAIYTWPFQSVYGGSATDAGNSVQQTTDGGYIIAGSTYSYGAGATDVYLVKTDSGGNKQWDKTFGGSAYEIGYSVQQTTDGGYIIAGSRESYYTADVYLVKTDSGGNWQWDKTFGGSGSDTGRSVQQTTDGGYIIAGWTDSYGAGSSDVYLVKTDSGGNWQWDKTFGGSGSDYGYSVQQTTDGGYIIAGLTRSYGAGSDDVYLVKTDWAGVKLWDKTFGGSGSDYGYSVQQTTDAGYIIAGCTNSYGAGSSDVYLVKTDSGGNKQWDKTFGGSGSDYGNSVQQTTDAGYIIAGRTYSYGAGSSDVYLVKTDSGGNKQWDEPIGGSAMDAGYSVQQTTDGGYIVTGNTYSYGAGTDDVYLVKTDASGKSTDACRDVIIEEGTSFIPKVVYKVLHDPPGDGSYSFLVEGQTQSIETILSVGASSTIGVKAEAKFAGNGVAASGKFTLSTSETVSSAFEVSQCNSSYSEMVDDPLAIGPGYGDFYIGEAWLFHYRIVDRTYLDGSTERLMEYGPTKESHFGMSAGWMRTHLDEETRSMMFALNPAHDNFINATELDSAAYLDSFFWTGGAPYDTSYQVSGRTKASLSFSVRVSESVALSCGFDIIPGTYIGGTVEVGFTFDVGITFETSIEQTTRIGYHLFDDDVGDSHQYEIWYDKVFGTYMFTCDRDLTESSNPREFYDNYAPNTPSLSGQTEGYRNTLYNYDVSATDPDDDDIYYEVNWGDGQTDLTGPHTSGTPVQVSHAWSSLGYYNIVAKAKDTLEAWSEESNLPIAIVNRPPYDPSAPSGPTSGITGVSYSFSTSTIDPDGDNVRYEFSWGDGTPNSMTDWKVSDDSASASHVWSLVGTWCIEVRAQDELLDWSNWSSPAYIQVNSGGGGCPYVSVWNGTHYVLDNNLIPSAEATNGTDVVDHYLIQRPLTKTDGKYSLCIWDLDKHSYLDKVQLIAVDHESDINIAVSPYGEVLTYRNPAALVAAIDQDNQDVSSILNTVDGNYFEGNAGDSILIDFGNLDVSNGAKLVLRTDYCPLSPCKIPYSIHILNATGSWIDVASIIPRMYWSTDIVDLSDYLPDGNGDVKLRLYFTATHKIDYVGMDTTRQGEFELSYANLVTANHNQIGNVKELLKNSDNLCVELLPGEHVILQFTLPETTQEIRDYIIVVEGHYFMIS